MTTATFNPTQAATFSSRAKVVSAVRSETSTDEPAARAFYFVTAAAGVTTVILSILSVIGMVYFFTLQLA